ncbi:hypothetical protein HK104_003214 [Borealophlyctis nickersoniae]|nr:hypothetical protein HK104_003214 [Borealophlyctis nickersoniae]
MHPLSRYLLIVRGHSLTSFQVKLYMSLGWLYMLASQTIPFWFGDRYILDPTLVYCMGNWGKRTVGGWVYTLVGMLNVGIPLLVFATMYILIINHVQRLTARSRRSFNTQAASIASTVTPLPAPLTPAAANTQKIEMLVLRKAMILMIVYWVCWLPLDVGFMWETTTGGRMQKPLIVTVLAVIGVGLNSMLNPLLQISLDKRWTSLAIDTLPTRLHRLFSKRRQATRVTLTTSTPVEVGKVTSPTMHTGQYHSYLPEWDVEGQASVGSSLWVGDVKGSGIWTGIGSGKGEASSAAQSGRGRV